MARVTTYFCQRAFSMHKLGTPLYGYVNLLKGFYPQELHDCAAGQVGGMMTLKNSFRVYESVTNTSLLLEDKKKRKSFWS